FGLKSSEFMGLLEEAIELINKKGIFVANTKSKAVHIDKTNNIPMVMGVSAIMGLAVGAPIAALGIAALSGIVAHNSNNILKKHIDSKEDNGLQLLTDIGTLKNIIQP